MKRLLILLFIGMFLGGCASLKESGFWEHETMFASWSHYAYSVWGYKNPSEKAQKLSEEQGWWGTPVPYIPAE
jgi:hypothetical protein